MTGAGRISQGDDARQPGTPGATPPVGSSIAWRLLPVLASAVAVVAADQGTKLWALSRLAGHRAVVLPGGWVELRLISNPGAAFSFGSGATWTFTLCATAVVAIVPWLAARARFRGQAIALGLLLGGAVANLLDRLFRAPGPGVGRVVDFIDYHGWFIGNVADIAIVASAGILIMRAMTDRGREIGSRSRGPTVSAIPEVPCAPGSENDTRTPNLLDSSPDHVAANVANTSTHARPAVACGRCGRGRIPGEQTGV